MLEVIIWGLMGIFALTVYGGFRLINDRMDSFEREWSPLLKIRAETLDRLKSADLTTRQLKMRIDELERKQNEKDHTFDAFCKHYNIDHKDCRYGDTPTGTKP